MIINWLGDLTFKLQDKTGSDGVSLLTDPQTASSDVQIATFSNPEHGSLKFKSQPFIIDCAGEYDTKGVMVEGIDTYPEAAREKGLSADNIIYRIEVDDISIVHLGSLVRDLNEDQLGKLSGVDVLLVPINGSTSKATEIIAQVEPRIVIPMGYKDSSVLDKFVKELGVSPTKEEKLRLTKKDLPQEEMELIILQAN